MYEEEEAAETPFVWLWQTLAQELGSERAEALRKEFLDRKHRVAVYAAAERARNQLPDIYRRLSGAKAAKMRGKIQQFEAMIAKRERAIAEEERLRAEEKAGEL